MKVSSSLSEIDLGVNISVTPANGDIAVEDVLPTFVHLLSISDEYIFVPPFVEPVNRYAGAIDQTVKSIRQNPDIQSFKAHESVTIDVDENTVRITDSTPNRVLSSTLFLLAYVIELAKRGIQQAFPNDVQAVEFHSGMYTVVFGDTYIDLGDTDLLLSNLVLISDEEKILVVSNNQYIPNELFFEFPKAVLHYYENTPLTDTVELHLADSIMPFNEESSLITWNFSASLNVIFKDSDLWSVRRTGFHHSGVFPSRVVPGSQIFLQDISILQEIDGRLLLLKVGDKTPFVYEFNGHYTASYQRIYIRSKISPHQQAKFSLPVSVSTNVNVLL